MTPRLVGALALSLAACFAGAREPAPEPSRAAFNDCAWHRLSDRALGLELFVQKCDYGFRRIDYAASAKDRAVYEVWRDTGSPEYRDVVIRVYEKEARERIEDAIGRLIISKLSPTQRRHCLVRRFHDMGSREDYVIAPDKKLSDEAAKRAGEDIPEPSCGDFGESNDGIRYFEIHRDENPRRFAFIDAGQDEPLFDEKSLLFLP